MKKLILCFLFAILSSCSVAPTAVSDSPNDSEFSEASEVSKKSKESPSSPSMKRKAKSCICTKIWMPVCGENNKTYGNSCEADCAGVKYTGGSCEEKE